jgi:N-acetylglucosaminyldiphosphoundecaprenol N-acetyl-beta-D-mannosaminyltransferase
MLAVGRISGPNFVVTRLTDFARDLVKLVLDNGRGYVCLANVHMIVTANRNMDLQGVMQKAIFVAPDGMPLMWSLKRQGFPEAERIAGSDLTLKICEIAARERIAVCFYGGTTKTMAALKSSLLHKFPQLKVADCESPPILPEKPEVDMEVVDRIKNSGAQLVFVGLGCPKQEFWMAAYSPHLPAVLIGVGAAFDFIAGTVKRAPIWMQRGGLEWLYRLLQEPLRLWRRYLVTNTIFALMVLKEILKGAYRQSGRP